MKTKNKIQLLVAALGGGVFSYHSVFASEYSGSEPLNDIENQRFDVESIQRSLGPDQSSDRRSSDPDHRPAPTLCRGLMQIRRPGGTQIGFGVPEPHQGAQDSMQMCGGRIIRPSASAPSKLILSESFAQHPGQSEYTLPRKSTLRGILSASTEDPELSGFLGSVEARLRVEIPKIMQRRLSKGLEKFVKLTVEGFVKSCNDKSIHECSIEELFGFSADNPDMYLLVRQDLHHSLRKSISIFNYAKDAIMGENGIINKIMNQTVASIKAKMNLIITCLQEDVLSRIDEEQIDMQIEQYVYNILLEIVPSLITNMYDLLIDDSMFVSKGGCCGCCGDLTIKDKENLTIGVFNILGPILDRFFPGCAAGASVLAEGICGVIRACDE
ncbi:MAG: hypothetical protein LBS71_02925 [Puniceicoccales bacterium]|jgi:hypothetical protein|nr:hypothetical protein [Puniceicoccales bacterium]